MERRLFLHTLGACAVATSPFVMAAPDPSAKVQSLSDALRWLDQLQQAPGIKTTGAWPLVAILEHMAQSIEMSMQGFPQPKSALFQNTLGTI